MLLPASECPGTEMGKLIFAFKVIIKHNLMLKTLESTKLFFYLLDVILRVIRVL